MLLFLFAHMKKLQLSTPVHYIGTIYYVNNYAVYLLFVNSYLPMSKKL